MKNITLLRHKGIGEPSCGRLVKRMAELGIEVTRTESYDDSLYNTDVLIRWGNTSHWPKHNKNLIVLNKRQSIELGSNKGESRKILQENGVKVPKTYFSKGHALDTVEKFPLIGRDSNHHTHGNGITFIKNLADLDNSNCAYYSEFIPKEREFRVYVFGNKAIGMAEKIPQNKTDLAWNSHKGATFVDVLDLENYQEIVNEGIKAAKVIGQYFSGVDLMTFNDKPYVLEVNSSLALSDPHRVNIFAQSFKNFINNH